MNGAVRALGSAVVALGLLAAARPALAGIVVYENGNVIQGPIDPREMNDESVTIKNARVTPGGERAAGTVVIPRAQIRWVDADSDALAPSYFEKFGDKFLDPKWARILVPEPEGQDPVPKPDIRKLLTAKHAQRVTRSWPEGDLSLRAPTNATLTESANVARFDLGGGAAIHVYSTLAPARSASTQLEWLEQAVAQLAGEGNFEADPQAHVMEVPDGHDARLLTKTKRDGVSLRALRHVCFREKRTYFVTAFAPEASFDGLKATFEAILDSVRVDEGPAMDLRGIEGGQVWRWSSPQRSDALVWEIRATTDHTFRYTETEAGEARLFQREAPARIEPRAMLFAVTRVPSTPKRVGHESLAVTNTTFDCEIFEASGDGKTFRLWIAPNAPGPVKVTVDGVVVRELAEIKR